MNTSEHQWPKPSTSLSPSPTRNTNYEEYTNVSTTEDAFHDDRRRPVWTPWNPWTVPEPPTIDAFAHILAQKDNAIRELRTLLDQCHTQIHLMRMELIRRPPHPKLEPPPPPQNDALTCHHCQRYYPIHHVNEFLQHMERCDITSVPDTL